MSREHKQHNYLTVWLTLLTHSVLAEPFWVGLYGVWARPASHARLAHAGSHAAGQRARFSSIFLENSSAINLLRPHSLQSNWPAHCDAIAEGWSVVELLDVLVELVGVHRALRSSR